MPYSNSRRHTTKTYVPVEPETKPPTSKGGSGAKPPTSKSQSVPKSSTSKGTSGAKLPGGKSHSVPKSSTGKSHPAKQNVTAKNQPSTDSSTFESRPGYQYRSDSHYPSGPIYMGPTTGQYYAGPSRPKMEVSHFEETVTVFKIPYNTPDMHLVTVGFLRIDAAISKSSQCEPEEYRLGRLPDLWNNTSKSFEWQHRSLIKIPAAEADPKFGYDYYMYKCKNSQVGLEANKYFAPCRGPRIYGDAFVFRVNAGCIDGHTQAAEYVNMDLGFVKELQGMGPAMSIVARLAELEKPGTG